MMPANRTFEEFLSTRPQGATVSEIADATGLTEPMVRYALRRKDVLVTKGGMMRNVRRGRRMWKLRTAVTA